jgi:hypothetical protein
MVSAQDGGAHLELKDWNAAFDCGSEGRSPLVGQLVMACAQIRQVLINTGTPQQAGVFPVSQHIGPLPNLSNALTQIIPAKLYLNTDPAGWVVTWTGCGYLESSPTLGPIPTWAPVEVGVKDNSYSFSPSSLGAEPTRFFRVHWH